MILLDPGVAGNANGVGAQDGLATARRETQADVRNVRQTGQRLVDAAVAPQPSGLLRLFCDGLVGVLRPGDARLLKEAAQEGEGVGSDTASAS